MVDAEPRAKLAAGGAALALRGAVAMPAPAPTIVSLTRPVVGRTMTLPVGTRLVGVHKAQGGLWVVLFNGAQFRAYAEPVEIPG